jgi:hypothetical protein
MQANETTAPFKWQASKNQATAVRPANMNHHKEQKKKKIFEIYI